MAVSMIDNCEIKSILRVFMTLIDIEDNFTHHTQRHFNFTTPQANCASDDSDEIMSLLISTKATSCHVSRSANAMIDVLAKQGVVRDSTFEASLLKILFWGRILLYLSFLFHQCVFF